MRLIFEPADDCYYFEVILNSLETKLLENHDGIVEEFTWDTGEVQDINVCIRKEGITCHSSKEKQPNLGKDSLRTSKEKWKPENPRSKQLLSLIRKRDGEKRVLPKKKGSSDA